MKKIKVTCNNRYCNFSTIYHSHTLESIKAHREFWSKIPVIDNECPHVDVNYEVIQK